MTPSQGRNVGALIILITIPRNPILIIRAPTLEFVFYSVAAIPKPLQRTTSNSELYTFAGRVEGTLYWGFIERLHKAVGARRRKRIWR